MACGRGVLKRFQLRPLWSSSGGVSWGPPPILYFSVAQAPRSICLQRSEQNGRKRLSGTQRTSFSQVGHLTIVVILQSGFKEVEFSKWGFKPNLKTAQRQVKRDVSVYCTWPQIAVLNRKAHPQHV